MEIANKTILITGGTSGIGLAMVKQLSPHNMVLVIARSLEKTATLFQCHKNIHCYYCDLRSSTDITDCVKQIVTDHPNISILINNAGIQYTPRFIDADFTIKSIKEEIQVNLHAPLILGAILINHWQQKNNKATIVNISSALAIFPKTTAAVYCATKAALHNFSRALSYQLESTDISVCEAILPLVDTPMTNGRQGKKISADMAAKEIILGICKQKKLIYVGKTKWIPFLARITPALIANILKKY